ncbi:major facilitator superfamily domain-containing protein [Collybia nuda]|uniref:Major facilitator superfamily domain-containing protein n=1 Tax=Collybia nuda TaxID=64659 RepID=A0A9P5XVD2_9AGAR|nr:major facilitator superfamily domain-containing protein [Collybia nuda]
MSQIELQPRKHAADGTTADSSTVGSMANGAPNGSVAGKETISGASRAQRIQARLQFAALCWCLFLGGWNDGTTGPLLPRIQKFYGVGFAVVSLLFVFSCVGFVAGALINVPLTDKLGFGKILVIGSLCQVIGYTLQAPALPFPVFVISYFLNGIGIALQDAQANGYVAAFKDSPEAKMAFLHAAYGAGALCSPLAATQFAQMRHWSFHYLISLGIAISNSIVLTTVFQFKTQDECLEQIGQAATEQGTSLEGKFKQILSHKTVHLLAFFILLYVGVEVTIGGWIVTFIINVRGGGPSSGYISAGFFGGLMAGRVLLLWVNQKIGERRALFLYAILAIGLELVVWLVPSLIGGAVAVSLVGVLLGPMYPIAINQTARVLPRWILTGSIGWIAGFGQAGSAVLPFLTGIISSKFGIASLQPLLITMMGLLIVVWAFVPKGPRRAE